MRRQPKGMFGILNHICQHDWVIRYPDIFSIKHQYGFVYVCVLDENNMGIGRMRSPLWTGCIQ